MKVLILLIGNRETRKIFRRKKRKSCLYEKESNGETVQYADTFLPDKQFFANCLSQNFLIFIRTYSQ